MKVLVRCTFVVCVPLLISGCDGPTSTVTTEPDQERSVGAEKVVIEPLANAPVKENVAESVGPASETDAGGLSTPESAYKTYDDAIRTNKFDVAFNALTPESRPAFVLSAGDTLAMRMTGNENEARKKLDQLKQKHGAPKSIAFFYIELRGQSPARQSAAIQSAYEKMTDVEGYLKSLTEIASAIPQPADEAVSEPGKSLSNVMINGDKANAMVGQTPVEFERHDGEWHVVADFRIGSSNRR